MVSQKNILRWVAAGVLAIGLLCVGLWWGVFRISEKQLPQKNPTEYVFDAPIADMREAMREAFASGYRGMHIVYPETNDPVLSGFLSEPGNENDAYMYNWHTPIGESPIYFRRGRPLPYLAKFHIHVTVISDAQTRVQIFTQNPEVIAGERPGIHGWAHNYVSVEPTTIEEYEILLRIGAELGASEMPELWLPE